MQTIVNYQQEGQKGPISHYVLLSGSPRRRELLGFLKPEVASTDVDERAIEEHFMAVFNDDDFLTRAAKVCCEISKAKSDIALEDKTLYISADTIVVSGQKILNKPIDLVEAKNMLLSYLGKSHYVVTSVCLRSRDFLEVFYAIAEVTFTPHYPELEGLIDTYVSEKRPLDKAGAYGIQELDPRLIQSIHGDIHTIIGLPVAEISWRLFGR